MNNRYICKAKRKDNGEWVEGFLYITHNGEYEISSYDEELDTERITCIVVPETVCRCTTLTDKNGKWIFEGDVVQTGGYMFVVKFGKCGGVANNENYCYMGYYLDGFDNMTKVALRLGLRNDICYFTDIEVIGNIHDGKDLLEVEK